MANSLPLSIGAASEDSPQPSKRKERLNLIEKLRKRDEDAQEEEISLKRRARKAANVSKGLNKTVDFQNKKTMDKRTRCERLIVANWRCKKAFDSLPMKLKPRPRNGNGQRIGRRDPERKRLRISEWSERFLQALAELSSKTIAEPRFAHKLLFRQVAARKHGRTHPEWYAREVLTSVSIAFSRNGLPTLDVADLGYFTGYRRGHTEVIRRTEDGRYRVRAQVLPDGEWVKILPRENLSMEDSNGITANDEEGKKDAAATSIDPEETNRRNSLRVYRVLGKHPDMLIPQVWHPLASDGYEPTTRLPMRDWPTILLEKMGDLAEVCGRNNWNRDNFMEAVSDSVKARVGAADESDIKCILAQDVETAIATMSAEVLLK